MQELNRDECKAIVGGVNINVGAAAGALAVGAMTGPVGFGMALGGVIISTGINSLIDLFKRK